MIMKKTYIAPCSAKYSVVTPGMFAISQTGDGASAGLGDFDNKGDQTIDGGDAKADNIWDVEW